VIATYIASTPIEYSANRTVTQTQFIAETRRRIKTSSSQHSYNTAIPRGEQKRSAHLPQLPRLETIRRLLQSIRSVLENWTKA
jgi:hypothetical protein